jgi:hypothetical protein
MGYICRCVRVCVYYIHIYILCIIYIWYINVYHLYGDLYGDLYVDLCGFNILYDLYQVIVNEIFMGFYIGLITVYMILSDFYGFLW